MSRLSLILTYLLVWQPPAGAGFIWIAASLALVIAAILLIRIGINRVRKRYFMCGVLVLTILAVYGSHVLFADWPTSILTFVFSLMVLYSASAHWNKRYDF